MNRLYAELETDRNQGLKMLYALERAGLLSLLSSKSLDLGNLSRPDKGLCSFVLCGRQPSPNGSRWMSGKSFRRQMSNARTGSIEISQSRQWRSISGGAAFRRRFPRLA